MRLNRMTTLSSFGLLLAMAGWSGLDSELGTRNVPQDPPAASATSPQGPEARAVRFPADLVGTWSGATVWTRASKSGSQDIPMGLIVEPLPPEEGETQRAWRFEIRYGSGESAQLRRYRMLEQDAERGLFVIDEGGGVLLDSWFDGAALRSVFEVQGTRLVSTWRPRGDQLEVDIVTTAAEVDHHVGEAKIGVLPVRSVQHAVLKRVPK